MENTVEKNNLLKPPNNETRLTKILKRRRNMTSSPTPKEEDEIIRNFQEQNNIKIATAKPKVTKVQQLDSFNHYISNVKIEADEEESEDEDYLERREVMINYGLDMDIPEGEYIYDDEIITDYDSSSEYDFPTYYVPDPYANSVISRKPNLFDMFRFSSNKKNDKNIKIEIKNGNVDLKPFMKVLSRRVPNITDCLWGTGIFMFNEFADEGVFDISRSGMVHLGHCATIALYFRKNLAEIAHRALRSDAARPLREAVEDIKRESPTHIAMGTLILALNDLLDSAASDTWLSIGCVAATLLLNRMRHIRSSKYAIKEAPNKAKPPKK